MQLEHSVLIEAIKERLTIQEVAERYTSIDFGRGRGVGNTISVRCPFHSDRSPSFTIWLDSNRWKCHAGCGHGDQIDLVGTALHIKNKEAIKLLADKLGLSNDEKEQQRIKEKVDAKKADRYLVQDYKEQFNDVFQRMIILERSVEHTLKNIKSQFELEHLGDLYHVRDFVGHLLDCMVHGDILDQIYAFKEARRCLEKWGAA